MKKYLLPLYFSLVGIWWGWTILVDFLVIPSVFGNIKNFFEAGNLGIIVFLKLNQLEFLVSIALLALLAQFVNTNKKILKFAILALLCAIIVFVYRFYLTDKIQHLTNLWQLAEIKESAGIQGIPDIQQEHQFYHKLYITLDSIKLIILSIMLGLGIWKQKDLTCEN